MISRTTQNTIERHFQPEQGNYPHHEVEPLLLPSPFPTSNNNQIWLQRSNKRTKGQNWKP